MRVVDVLDGAVTRMLWASLVTLGVSVLVSIWSVSDHRLRLFIREQTPKERLLVIVSIWVGVLAVMVVVGRAA